jgi:hypothetical protein
MSLDEMVGRAVALAARELEVLPDVWAVREKPEFHEAFRRGLRQDFGDQVLPYELRLPISDWEAALDGRRGALGPVDVLVVESPDCYRLLAELKWCRHKHEVWWTLWDIYKLVAAQEQYAPQGSFVVAAAPVSYWADAAIDCSALFVTQTWKSRRLFVEYERAWRDLLGGGRARPSRVPTVIATELVASERLTTVPEWEIRALKVAAASNDWLAFDGDWPTELPRA